MFLGRLKTNKVPSTKVSKTSTTKTNTQQIAMPVVDIKGTLAAQIPTGSFSMGFSDLVTQICAPSLGHWES